MPAHVGKKALHPGLALAEQAYGKAVRRHIGLTLSAFQRNRVRAAARIKSLAVEDTAALRKGLRVLRGLL